MAQDSTVKEKMEVVLRQINVRVLNEQGEPVTGLKPADFQAKLRRKNLEIRHFEEIKPDDQGQLTTTAIPVRSSGMVEVPAPKPMNRMIVIMFDSAVMTPPIFKQTVTQLKRFVEEKVGPQDLVKLTHLEDKWSQVTGFTTDKEALMDALDGLEYRGTLRNKLEMYMDIIANAAEDEERGKRANSATTMDQYTLIKKRVKSAHYTTFTYGLEAVYRMLENQKGDRAIFLVTGGSYHDFHLETIMERASSQLNSQNIAIHTLHARETKVIGEKGMNRVTSLHRFTNSSGLGSNMAERDNTLNTIGENGRQINTGPFEAATQTGGAYALITDEAVMAEVLDQIDHQSKHYYSLWVSGKIRNKKVKLSIPGHPKYELRYGLKAAAPKAYRELKKEDREMAFMSALQFGTNSGDGQLAAVWGHQFFGSDERGYRVPLSVRIEDPIDGHEYELGFALLDEDRQIMAVHHKVLAKIPSKDVSFFDILAAEKRPAMLSCTVRDLSDDALHKWEVALPGAPEEFDPTLSSLVLIQPGANRPYASLLDVSSLGDFNPLNLGEQQLPPSFESRFTDPKFLYFYFNLDDRKGAHDEQEVFLALTRDGQRVAVPAQLKSAEDLGNNGSRYLYLLGTQGLPHGTYKLHIKVLGAEKSYVMGTREFTIGDASSI